MRVVIRHVTHYAYEPKAARAALRLKLFPARFASQRVLDWQVRVNGETVAALFANGFGDQETIWTAKGDVGALEVSAEGIVETQDAAGLVKGLAEAARPGVFLRSTALTGADDAILTMAQAARRDSALATLHALSEAIADAIAYQPGATHSAITAGEALALKEGVCQDHAHVFLAAARALSIPARYVAGYLADGPRATPDTHAWAEAFVPDLGWIGFDPTNRMCPTDAYVRLAAGLDAVDAAPIRGCISHGVREDLSTRVEITHENHGAQTQSQGAQVQNQ
jgi:transglutaminase-like putative cysteine protease